MQIRLGFISASYAKTADNTFNLNTSELLLGRQTSIIIADCFNGRTPTGGHPKCQAKLVNYGWSVARGQTDVGLKCC